MFGQNYHSSVRSIRNSDGLSHYRILSFLAEPDGMWIGTENGLNFYDGYDWQYWAKDAGHFSDANVNFLLKDQLGYLWVFHNKEARDKRNILSIDLLSPDRNSISSILEVFKNNLPFQVDHIQQFFSDAQDRLYFVSDGRLWRYSKQNQFEELNIP